jgi:4-hydroxythreonine-4-phosphate dehydrogenase
MLLLNKKIRVSLVTRHTALKKVPGNLNQNLIYKNILLTYGALKKLFSIKEPRIVVCGLNPHASDGGLIGNEENRIIIPALKRARRKVRQLDGPISADVAMHKTNKGEYDCAIAMYHDQALVPLKLSDKDTGVNMTVGLPFIRTSPLHGTAFDIAKNPLLANPDSLIEAVKLAIKCTANLKKD